METDKYTLGELKEAIRQLQEPSAPGGPVSDDTIVYIGIDDRMPYALERIVVEPSAQGKRSLVLVREE